MTDYRALFRKIFELAPEEPILEFHGKDTGEGPVPKEILDAVVR